MDSEFLCLCRLERRLCLDVLAVVWREKPGGPGGPSWSHSLNFEVRHQPINLPSLPSRTGKRCSTDYYFLQPLPSHGSIKYLIFPKVQILGCASHVVPTHRLGHIDCKKSDSEPDYQGFKQREHNFCDQVKKFNLPILNMIARAWEYVWGDPGMRQLSLRVIQRKENLNTYFKFRHIHCCYHGESWQSACQSVVAEFCLFAIRHRGFRTFKIRTSTYFLPRVV